MFSPVPRVFLCTLFALILLGSAVPAHAQLGIAGGLNFESGSDIEVSTADNATFDNATGYHVGVVYDLGLGPVSLRPGLIYRRVGTFQFSGSAFPGGESRYDVSAWEVPLDLRFSLLPSVIRPYLLGGPMVTFPQGEEEFDDAVDELSFSLNIGAGVEIAVPGSPFVFQPELRYEFGATDYISDDFEIGDAEFHPQESPRFSALGLRLHVLF